MPKFREVLLALVCFGLLYWSIVQYDRWIVVYRDTVATAAMVVANLLLVSYWVLCQKLYVPSARTALAWSIFLALGFLSASLAKNPDNAMDQLWLYFSMFLLGLGFRAWFDKPSRRLVVSLLLAICLVHVLILVVVVGHAMGVVADPVPQRPSVPYHSNIRHVAHHGMVAACAGLSLLFIGGRFRLTGYMLGFVSIFGLVFLGQRGGLLGLAVFVAVAAYLLPQIRVRLIVAALSALLICVGMVYLLDRHGVSNRYSGSIVERARASGSEVFTNGSGRLAVWESSIDLGLQRPLLGHGPDGYRTSEIRKPVAHIFQSHNLFVQAFVEFGALGLLLICVFLYRSVRQQFRSLMRTRGNLHAEPDSILLFGTFMGFLAYSQVEGLFYHSVSLLMAAVLAPLAFAATAAVVPREDEFMNSPSL